MIRTARLFLSLLAGCSVPAARPAPQGDGPAALEIAPVPDRPPSPVRVNSEPAPALPAPVPEPLPPASSSTSLGSCTNGKLEGGVALPLAGPGFRFNDRRSRDARYGTVEVVGAIERAAALVARELPGGELVVNDLSLPAGGPISHHGSHRAGRDADLLFYLLDEGGLPIASVGAPLDPEGRGHDYRELARAEDDVPVRLDAARTWRFVRALLEDEQASVQRLFVVEHLRTLLLEEARRAAAPAATIARFSELTCQPSYPHDDHLHVRWFCSLEDIARGCEDLPPLYPHRLSELQRAGVKPVLARRSSAAVPPELVTREQASAQAMAQQPHPDVLRFLERRRAWERMPHPGRPFCP